MNKEKVNNDLDILMKYKVQIMGVAAIMILFFHIWNMVLNKTTYFGYLEIILNDYGNYGVDMFFILSGLGCFVSINKNTIKQFYYNRFKRIYFTFLLITTIQCLISHNSIIEYIKNITFYSFYFEYVHSTLWFVPAIVTLYLFFPLYYKFFSKAKDKTIFTILACIISLTAAHAICYLASRPDFSIFICRIPEFLIGIFMAWFIKNKNFELTTKKQLIIHILLVIGIIIEYLRLYRGTFKILSSTPKYIIGITLIIVLAKLFDNMFKNKKMYILTFFGNMSFQLYCIQTSYIVSYLNIYLNNLNVLITNIITISIICLVSYLLYILDKNFWKTIDKKD